MVTKEMVLKRGITEGTKVEVKCMQFGSYVITAAAHSSVNGALRKMRKMRCWDGLAKRN